MRFVRGGSVRGCQGFCLVWGPSRNWGLHPEPRRRSRHSRGEKYVLAGKAGQNMIPFSFPACGRGNSARRALPGGNPRRRAHPAPVPTQPPARGSPVLRALRVGRALTGLGAQRPGGPACPAGVPISPEKWGERGPGLRPWTPLFIAARCHSLVFGMVGFGRVMGPLLPVS